ncbi:hypothetical protein Sme01_60060 [Sphaerisporangium melleum]|uniref:DUF11 domain-containing protein n=1 Tax=Sphaerisporangium melleum TaxID=321316 RepID=A0A917RC32_9ACTN|nr:DUF11 domain-containing protein [Sphaerisporangium melleum]GGK98890.1 hypothetical protein GCM10007964_46250 [Sphaerisporangium melleum]GII73530.1 hypothetical protein Sme01_60060 [Sphaerisporangium melleum]
MEPLPGQIAAPAFPSFPDHLETCMRHSFGRLATTLVTAPLAGALLFTATPASAAPAAGTATESAATTAADKPYSSFAVTVTGPKKVKRGGTLVYRIKAVNKGPYTADSYYLGGLLPKGRTGTVYYDAPKGTECDFYPDGFWCWSPYELEEGESDWLTIEVKLKKSVKGSVSAKLGVNTFDLPTGAEDLNRSELARLDVKDWYFTKTVKTKVG